MIMEYARQREILTSSFVVDAWIDVAARNLKINTFKASYASIGSLFIGGIPVNAVLLASRDGS